MTCRLVLTFYYISNINLPETDGNLFVKDKMVLSNFKNFEKFPSVKRFGSRCSDDWVDRLSHVYTVMMLLVVAVVVSTAHFVGEAIRCWIPAEFNKDTQSFEKYILNHCWIKNTYHIPMQEAIPTNVTQREDEEISYYQWVPLVLLLLALFFKFPHVIWTLLHNSSGLNLHKVCSMAQSTCVAEREKEIEIITTLATTLDRWIKNRQQYKNTTYVRIRAHLSHLCGLCANKREGTFLTALYLFAKFLYLANVVGQIIVLNAFISSGSGGIFALEWLSTFISGPSSSHIVESQRFPRVTFCDFKIRQLNNVQRYTVQCVLPINLFNEKLFLFLWFWFCFVAMVTIINFSFWFYLIQKKENNYIFVKKYLKIGKKPFSKSDCKKFANEYLRSDGCFVLRMIGKNSSDLVVVDVLKELFTQYLERVQTHKTEDMDQTFVCTN